MKLVLAHSYSFKKAVASVLMENYDLANSQFLVHAERRML